MPGTWETNAQQPVVPDSNTRDVPSTCEALRLTTHHLHAQQPPRAFKHHALERDAHQRDDIWIYSIRVRLSGLALHYWVCQVCDSLITVAVTDKRDVGGMGELEGLMPEAGYSSPDPHGKFVQS